MRNLKRVLSLALACVMVIGMMVMTTGAADFTDSDEITNVEAVEVMSALGILEGYNGEFNPDRILTREEAAKIICYMLIGPTAADNLAKTSTFTDVEDGWWSAGFISYCANLGIIAGNGDGTYGPTDELTDVAFGKMLLVALGYDAEIEGYVNNKDWSTNIGGDMIEAGINNGAVTGTAVTRENAAQMAFQTLTATMVYYNGGMNITTGDGTSIVVDSERYEKSETGYQDYLVDGGDTKLQFCEKNFPNLMLNKDETDKGLNVDKWFIDANNDRTNATTEVVAVVDGYTVLGTYYTKTSEGDLAKLTGLDSGTAAIWENGADASATATITKDSRTDALTGYEGAKIEIIRNNDDNSILAYVTYSFPGVVTKVNEAEGQTKRNVEITVYNGDDGADVTSVVYETEEFAEDDFVLVYPNVKYATAEAYTVAGDFTGKIAKVEAADVVYGKFTEYTGTQAASVTSFTVNGTKYSVAADKFATHGNAADTLVKATAIATAAFDKNFFYVLNNGYVVAVVEETAATLAADLSDFIYVNRDKWSNVDTETGNTNYYVEAIYMDGTVKVLTSTDDTFNITPTNNLYKVGTHATSGELTLTAAVVMPGGTDPDTTDPIKENALNGAIASSTGKETSVLVDDAANSSTEKAYITADTVFLFVKEGKTPVAVTGSVKGANLANDSKVLVSKTGSNFKARVIVLDEQEKPAEVTAGAEVLYVTATAEATLSNGTRYTAYVAATGEKTNVILASAPTAGFYTYAVNEKTGLYTLTNSGAVLANNVANNSDGVWTISADAMAHFEGLISITTPMDGTASLDDIDASNAVIINLSTTAGVKDAKTLKDLAELTNITGMIQVKDGAVTYIVVTNGTV